MSERKRFITDLRVIDLRLELEKRNLDKSGVRGVLIQRLSKHLKEEGHNPEKFVFEVADAKTPSKRSKRSDSAVEQEDTPAMEDMIVQDDLGEEEEAEQQESSQNKDTNNQKEKMEVEKEKPSRKRENNEEPEAAQPKKPCIETDTKIDEDQKNIENNDAEDSINLDLGEDELLNEETDNTTKTKKDDEGAAAAASAADDHATGASSKNDKQSTGDNHQDGNKHGASTTSDANDESGDKDHKDDKDKDDGTDKKDKKDDSKEGGARNLWVSGLSGDTRAKDLKQLCSKFGKVIGAKVVTNARTPGSRCYGYVTMASAHDAESCIKNLHRTELHGRMISVEKAKSESDMSSKKQPTRRSSQDKSKDTKEDADKKDKEEKDNSADAKTKDETTPNNRSTSRNRDKNHRSDKDKPRRSTRSRERRRSPQRDVLSFNKIWKERDMARARERSRAAREEERRRRAAEEALRERERRQRLEKQRLAQERDKLRAERERIEREKNELLRLERERHRLEREKLELERLELKRAQLRLEEERRKRGYESSYRKVSSPPSPAYDTRHKRQPPPPPPTSSGRGGFEAPPPPRFEPAPAYERDKRDYKQRDYPRHMPPSNIKYPANGSSNDDARQPLPPGTRPKEPGRSYESRSDSRAYRPSPPAPAKPEGKPWPSARYPDPAAPAKGKPYSASGNTSEAWASSGGGGGDTRYGNTSGAAPYEQQRYPPAYPATQTTAYPDRYRDYRKY